MSSHNKMIIGAIVIIVILIGIYMSSSSTSSSSTEEFTYTDLFESSFDDPFQRLQNLKQSDLKDRLRSLQTPTVSEEFSVENYPQSTPMNVMYSDSNGNLATTTDLGLQNLTVSGDSTFANDNVIINSGDIAGPGKQTRINSQGIIFGGSNNGREVNSAQITAGKHDANALCIVGMSDTNKANRRIHTWAEGGMINEGEIASRLSSGPGQFRAAHGDYGTIFRQDGDNFYVLTTKKGDQMGTWGDTRPLYINNASGDVTMAHNLSVGGRVLAGKNLQTNRNRVCFSNGVDDPNHSIYNNNNNIDGEGQFDGMKMNVYAGLDVRTGNANGAVPKTVLSVRDDNVNVNGKMSVHSGAPWAVPNGKMSNGSVTIGDINKNFGGGSGWTANTAGLMMECADTTEIAVHDAGTRVASAMNYHGPSNTIEVGRDMGWGPSTVSFGGQDVFRFGRYAVVGTQWKSTDMAFNDWHAMISGVANTRLWEQNNETRVAPINGIWHIYIVNSRYIDAGNGSTVDVTFLSKRMKNSLAAGGAKGY